MGKRPVAGAIGLLWLGLTVAGCETCCKPKGAYKAPPTGGMPVVPGWNNQAKSGVGTGAATGDTVRTTVPGAGNTDPYPVVNTTGGAPRGTGAGAYPMPGGSSPAGVGSGIGAYPSIGSGSGVTPTTGTISGTGLGGNPVSGSGVGTTPAVGKPWESGSGSVTPPSGSPLGTPMSSAPTTGVQKVGGFVPAGDSLNLPEMPSRMSTEGTGRGDSWSNRPLSDMGDTKPATKSSLPPSPPKDSWGSPTGSMMGDSRPSALPDLSGVGSPPTTGLPKVAAPAGKPLTDMQPAADSLFPSGPPTSLPPLSPAKPTADTNSLIPR